MSLQTKQYLLDTRLNLQKMVRTLHVTDQSLMSLAVISDTSWAWGAIQRYTPILHERIRKDPQCVLKLRCLFLKLKSVLELPLLRISQIGSPDVYSVGEFYSQELVGYVRTVVEVIPKSMFSILTRIIAVQTAREDASPTAPLPGNVVSRRDRVPPLLTHTGFTPAPAGRGSVPLHPRRTA